MTTYHLQATLTASTLEAEYHLSNSNLAQLFSTLSSQISIDLGPGPINTISIFIHKDTLDGED